MLSVEPSFYVPTELIMLTWYAKTNSKAILATTPTAPLRSLVIKICSAFKGIKKV